MNLTIGAIGSCRIATPLRVSRDDYGHRINIARNYGFTHASGEAVQLMQFMKGMRTPDEKVWNLLARSADMVELAKAPLEIADFYVVEISSAKSVRIGEDFIQLNYLQASFQKFFADAARVKQFWELASIGKQALMDAFLDRFWRASEAEQQQSDILRLVRSTRVNDTELRADIRNLIEGLPGVLFVTHVNALRPSGLPLRSRAAFITQVEAAVAAEGGQVYNPTALMQKFGQEWAIADHSDSLAHFTDEFSLNVFQDWYRIAICPLIDRIATTRQGIAKRLTNLEARLSAGAFDEVVLRTSNLVEGAAGVQDLRPLRAQALPKIGMAQETMALFRAELAADRTNVALREMILPIALRNLDLATAAECARDLIALGAPVPAVETLLLARAFAYRQSFSEAIALGLAAMRAGADAAEVLLPLLGSDGFGAVSDDQLRELLSMAPPGERLWDAIKAGRPAILHEIMVATVALPVDSILTEVNCCKVAGHPLVALKVIARWREVAENPELKNRALLAAVDVLFEDYPALAAYGQRLQFLTAVLAANPGHKVGRAELMALRREIGAKLTIAYAAGDVALLEILPEELAPVPALVARSSFCLARLRLKASDLAGASEAAWRAVTLDPQNGAIWLMILRCAHGLGDSLTVAKAADRILALEANDITPQIKAQAEALLKSHVKRAYSAARSAKDPIQQRKLYLLAARSPDLADRAQRQVSSIESGLTVQLRNMERADGAGAVAFARKLLAEMPHNEKILLSLARLYEKHKDYAAAFELFDALTTVSPDDPSYIMRRDRSRARLGQTAHASDLFRKGADFAA